MGRGWEEGGGKVRKGTGEKLGITGGTKTPWEAVVINLAGIVLVISNQSRAPFLYFTRLAKKGVSLPLSHGNICGHCVNYSFYKE